MKSGDILERKGLLKDNDKLMSEYNYKKNKKHDLNVLTLGSDKKVWWKCLKCNYEWQATIGSRNRGAGCPNCAGNIKKNNSKFISELQNINPNLISLEEYDGWDKKIKFRCEICGSEWKASPGKILNGRGCPNCGNKYQTSFPEQALLYYIKREYKDTISRYNENGYEIDIYVPNLRIGVEYDGYNWHKSKLENDNKKDSLCQNDNIKLIRIREFGLSKTNNSINIFRNENDSQEDLEKCIEKVLSIINNKKTKLNISQDRLKILELYKSIIKNNVIDNKILLNEWNYEKNGTLKPEYFSNGSSEKVWWKCSNCGHEWEACISDRNNGNGCPACYGRVPIKGKNDLQTLLPELSNEWNYNKNKNILPNDFLPNSTKKVWWKCTKCGYEWQATIGNRTKGTGCPACYGRVPVPGKNDLQTMAPELLRDWEFDKNIEISPNEVLPKSNKKVWWKCSKCGYEWQSIIANRYNGSGCPMCAIKRRKKTQN